MGYGEDTGEIMKQLEFRTYTPKEMCEITSVRYEDSGHRMDNIKKKLNKWGYGYEFPKKGNITITRKPESSEAKLNEILLRRLKLSTQIVPLHFASFIFAFEDIEGFASMPWEERARELYNHYGVSVCDRTLRNWCSKLLNKELIAKVDDRTYWKTEIMNGRKTRTPIQQGDAEMTAYFSKRSALIAYYRAEGEKSKIPVKELKNFSIKLAVKDLWEEYHCCYYTCKTFLFSAWEDDEEPFFQEVVELTQDIMYTKNF